MACAVSFRGTFESSCGTEGIEGDCGADESPPLFCSGCPFCCGESFVRDIGIFGKKKGWTFIIGGSSARRPRIGDILKEDLDRDEVIDLTKRCLQQYGEKAKKKERMAWFVDRIGIENVKEAVLSM